METKAKQGRRLNQQERILEMLKTASSRGCSGAELSSVHWRFGSSIFLLRQKGWVIETLEKPDESSQYFLRGTATIPQLDLARPQAPANPSSKDAFGICACNHAAGSHRKDGGACFDCNCSRFTPQ